MHICFPANTHVKSFPIVLIIGVHVSDRKHLREQFCKLARANMVDSTTSLFNPGGVSILGTNDSSLTRLRFILLSSTIRVMYYPALRVLRRRLDQRCRSSNYF